MNYYDLVLGLIPLALIGIAVPLVLTGVDLTVAVPLAGSVSVGLIGHALFVNGPTDADRPASREPTGSPSSFEPAD